MPELAEHSQWFVPKPKLQSTWKQLIRVQLARLGRETAADDVRRYQRDEFAASGGQERLLELLPLPSPSVSDWRYPEWSELPWLGTRDAYRQHLLDRRIEALRDLISKHAPAVVLFYSKTYTAFWEAVVGRPFDGADVNGVRYLRTEPTTYVLTPHPVAHGTSNAMFTTIGGQLATSP